MEVTQATGNMTSKIKSRDDGGVANLSGSGFPASNATSDSLLASGTSTAEDSATGGGDSGPGEEDCKQSESNLPTPKVGSLDRCRSHRSTGSEEPRG